MKDLFNHQSSDNVLTITPNFNPAILNFPELTPITDFKAVPSPVYMGDHNGAGFERISNQKVIRRDDTGEALGIVGNRYGIARNAGLYNMLTKAATETLPANATRDCELKEVSSHSGAYTRFELAFPNMPTTIRQRNGETELKFRVGISNTFDGNGSVRVFAGAYDLVCENGLTIGEVTKTYSRHTKGYTPEVFADFIRHEMAEYLTRSRQFQKWADSEITPDQAENVLKLSGLSERRVNSLMDQFHTETINRGPSIWSLFSALTFYSSHNSERFAVRNAANSDNVGVTLEQREREVTKITSGNAWTELEAIAA